MVTCYMLLVFVILCLNFDKLPGVLASIFQSAFSLEAGDFFLIIISDAYLGNEHRDGVSTCLPFVQ